MLSICISPSPLYIKLRLEWPADQPQTKPSPGWWPCEDFPHWLELLSGTIRAHNPDADIVFWTYNWGYAPKEDRLKLLRAMERSDGPLHSDERRLIRTVSRWAVLSAYFPQACADAGS
ncbi:hypothetical protein J4772_24530 [Cohnella sp. LGH]|uniref:hypothetical protein n=1 Tax=Cohnella sp. LGH TaxID=1619153 RepID=UPI001ADCC85B|nr:hypothetical protein [Cohnella sp. LGH]QTH40720.1 hypothetical protein J4772_24530 [Cohnella sp. LGH]